MRRRMEFDLMQNSDQLNLTNYFKRYAGTVYMQDTIHIGTKLRNRLLKEAILPIGNYLVSIGHIKILLKSVSKEIHGLTYSDICPTDRQNYKSLEKTLEERVLNALKKHTPNSEATIKYLNIFKQITSSILSSDMQPLDRVYKLWKWLKSPTNSYSTTENGITSNAYQCIEVNGHSLIASIQLFRDMGKPEHFIPNLFSSQPCESTFRTIRSMGTANFTKINFNLFEVIHLIRRVELVRDIIHSNPTIVFPKSDEQFNYGVETNIEIPVLPSDEAIKSTLMEAQKDAIESAKSFGLYFESIEDCVQHCQINILDPKGKKLHSSSDNASASTSVGSLQTPEVVTQETSVEDASEDDSQPIDSEVDSESTANRNIVEVKSEDGSSKWIKKSTLVWLLTDSKGKLSSDRLKRVQEMTSCGDTDYINQLAKRRRIMSKSTGEVKEVEVIKADEAAVGDWCFFKFNANIGSSESEECEELSDNDVLKYCVLGNILSFRLKTDDGKNRMKDQTQTNEPSGLASGCIASVDPTRQKKKIRKEKFVADYIQLSDKNATALASWYRCNNDGTLVPVQPINHLLIPVENYVGTVINPFRPDTNSGEISQVQLKLNLSDLDSIKSMLVKYMM